MKFNELSSEDRVRHLAEILRSENLETASGFRPEDLHRLMIEALNDIDWMTVADSLL